jgi:rhodanese-related sulfurtransferase
MDTIEREELKTSLDRGDPIRLVMTMHEPYFEAAHIPGSVRVFSIEDADTLRPNDDIVVYCSHVACAASLIVGQKLVDAGFARVRHYAGGLSDWEAGGYSLEAGPSEGH